MIMLHLRTRAPSCDRMCAESLQLDDLYVFDPSINVWTDLTSMVLDMPYGREGAGFTSLGGSLYLQGGFSSLFGAFGAINIS